MFSHLLYLVSKGVQDMHRERSDGLEVEGVWRILEGLEGVAFSLRESAYR